MTQWVEVFLRPLRGTATYLPVPVHGCTSGQVTPEVPSTPRLHPTPPCLGYRVRDPSLSRLRDADSTHPLVFVQLSFSSFAAESEVEGPTDLGPGAAMSPSVVTPLTYVIDSDYLRTIRLETKFQLCYASAIVLLFALVCIEEPASIQGAVVFFTVVGLVVACTAAQMVRGLLQYAWSNFETLYLSFFCLVYIGSTCYQHLFDTKAGMSLAWFHVEAAGEIMFTVGLFALVMCSDSLVHLHGWIKVLVRFGCFLFGLCV